jgi:hypothetical protein
VVSEIWESGVFLPQVIASSPAIARPVRLIERVFVEQYSGSLDSRWITSQESIIVKQGYRLIVVDKAGVLVSEFQLTEQALAQPDAFVAALKQSIEDIEEQEP